MRRIVLAGLGTVSSVVLLLAYPTSHNASVASTSDTSAAETGSSSDSSSSSTADPASSGTSSSTGTKTYTGDAVDTRWGTVQVKITVVNGKITKSEAVQYPNENGRDQEINSYALPILAQEVVTAQSANIDSVSGATVTSGGYVQSLQSALDAANL
jgi:uncharacterized protein with FMN-binding domain